MQTNKSYQLEGMLQKESRHVETPNVCNNNSNLNQLYLKANSIHKIKRRNHFNHPNAKVNFGKNIFIL